MAGLSDFICFDATRFPLQATDAIGAIRELAVALESVGAFPESELPKVVESAIAGVRLGPTAMDGAAFPVGLSSEIEKPVSAIGFSTEGVEFDSFDEEPVFVVFFCVLKNFEAGQSTSAPLASSLFSFLSRERERLMSCRSAHEIRELIEQSSAAEVE
jgi:mannitol/fructose-specific phosphotransferase system IIA component (Ntr-type)